MMVPAEISAGFCCLPPVAFPANLPYFTRNMKLLTYDAANGPRAGVVVDGQVLDIATLLKEQDGLRDIRALLELPNDPLTRLKSALSSARTTQAVPLDGVRLRAPILQLSWQRQYVRSTAT